MKLFDNVDAATLQTESRSYAIRAHELEISPPLDPPVRNEMGNYDRREHKAAEQTRAMEWNSIPAGLPFSPEGIWPAPKNEEEDALCRVRADCMQLQPPAAQFCLRPYSVGTPWPPGPSSSGQSSGSNTLGYGHGPVLTWQPSASTSPGTLWLSSEEGYMWVSCMHPMAWGAPRSQGLALVRNRHARGTTDRGPTG